LGGLNSAKLLISSLNYHPIVELERQDNWQAVGDALTQAGIKKVGLLGTQFTMEDGFYTHRLQDKFNLEIIIPPLDERKTIDGIIYQELCLGKVLTSSKIFFINSIKALEKVIIFQWRPGADSNRRPAP
jgi:aspartate/glutamate racemase